MENSIFEVGSFVIVDFGIYKNIRGTVIDILYKSITEIPFAYIIKILDDTDQAIYITDQPYQLSSLKLANLIGQEITVLNGSPNSIKYDTIREMKRLGRKSNVSK